MSFRAPGSIQDTDVVQRKLLWFGGRALDLHLEQNPDIASSKTPTHAHILLGAERVTRVSPLGGEPWTVIPEVNTPDTSMAQDPQPAFLPSPGPVKAVPCMEASYSCGQAWTPKGGME